MDDALGYLAKHSIDLCMLDLNLKGKNGYKVLQTAVSQSFHTIVVSAHTEQAFQAFDYGILDFVPKPVDYSRLQKAFSKYFGTVDRVDPRIKYLVVRRRNSNHLISMDEIRFFEAQGYLVKIHLKDNKSEFIEKPLNRLLQILPKRFLRVHRSYVVDMDEIDSYRHKGGGTYEMQLKSGEILQMSAKTYRQLTANHSSK